MNVELTSIRRCLDGAVPAAIATVSADGIPNVSYVSEVHYVDTRHVALSYQFFNKTRSNIMANGAAQALVIDPTRGEQFRLELRFLRTETSGPVFETMRVKLAGIAAHTGMTGIFRLLGADIYEVLDVVATGTGPAAVADEGSGLLSRVRTASERLGACPDLESLVDALLDALQEDLGVRHSILFLLDGAGDRLYLLGSRGYAESGVGSEIPLGRGIVGLAAAERTPIRITHMAEEFRYSHAVRRHTAEVTGLKDMETAIPLPGLSAPGSQLAVPVTVMGRLLGVLCVESPDDGAFGYDSEDALVTIANQFAGNLHLLDDQHGPASPAAAGTTVRATGSPLRIRFIDETSSVFIDDSYLIKGVAGAILWKLLRDYTDSGRTEFSNRELRSDPSIRLPEYSENLEARLVLLKRRLLDQSKDIAIVPVARGRFALRVTRPLRLEVAGRSRGPS